MRTVGAWLLATVWLLLPPALARAAPPEDIAAYCRTTYPQLQFQVRCLNVENAAAERVSRAASAADSDIFGRCLAASISWASMEACLAQSARGVPLGGVPGMTNPPTAAVIPSTSPDSLGGAPPGPRSPDAALPTPAGARLDAPPSSTTVMGPEAATAAAAAPENRPTRPISEADADRHLRGVLERAGVPAAQCNKKQYGPGWVSICQ
jgi:hypothetical protein